MKKNIGSLCFMLASAAAGVAHAQYLRPAYAYPAPDSASGPAKIQVGNSPVYFSPFVGLGYGHDDNLFLSPALQRSSDFAVFSPGFSLDARSSHVVLQSRYQAQIGRYFDSPDDDYVDHAFRNQVDVAFDRRNFMRVGYDYIRGHDPRGSTDRPPVGEPDRYKLSIPSFTYAFGTPGAAGRVEAYYNQAKRTYLNNRALTVLNDRTNDEYGAAFYWRVAPKTYALAEVRKTDIKYKDPRSALSAEEMRYYIGVSWEATAATTGTLKVGRLERQFERDLPRFTGPSWEAMVTWAPRTYSKLDLYSARQTNESTGLGNFIVTSITGVTWTHAWSSVVTTGVDLRYTKDEYQGFDRRDEIRSVGLKAGYRFRRWLTIGAEYTYTDRDSNRPNFDYDQNLYLLTATASK